MLRRITFLILGSMVATSAPAQGLLPIVTSVSESADATQITIKGTSFGSALPGLTLGGATLKVLTATSSAIAAQLPAGLAPGSYLLTVVNNNTHLPTIFEVTLGAQGLTGATGAVGSQGFTGAPGTPGLQGAVGLPGPTGSQGLPGATGATGTGSGQVWTASFTMPNELNATNPGAGWNRVRNCSDPTACSTSTGGPNTTVPIPTVAPPSGSGQAIALAPQLTANTAIAFLTVPASCTAYNLNAYVLGVQSPSYGATVSVATADPFNDVVVGAGAPQFTPTTTPLFCQISGGQGGATQQCTSSGNAATLLTGGQLVTIVVTPADTSDALIGAQVFTTFSCDTTNTTGVISTPIPSGWNRVKNVQ